MIHFVIDHRILSRNQLDKMHWSQRGKVRQAWTYLFRAQLRMPYTQPLHGDCRALVTIFSHRNRLIDDDNLAGGGKPVLDAMKHVGLIKDDNRTWCRVSYDQYQVPKTEEKTEVFVSYERPAEGKETDMVSE